MSEAFIPSEVWVEDQETNPEYDSSCPTCSTLVENRKIHREWHIAMMEKIEKNEKIPKSKSGGKI